MDKSNCTSIGKEVLEGAWHQKIPSVIIDGSLIVVIDYNLSLLILGCKSEKKIGLSEVKECAFLLLAHEVQLSTRIPSTMLW